jgi:hypothetical protein
MGCRISDHGTNFMERHISTEVNIIFENLKLVSVLEISKYKSAVFKLALMNKKNIVQHFHAPSEITMLKCCRILGPIKDSILLVI